MDFLTYPIAFLILLGVLVTIHEFGHYLVARASGVQILRFSVGFGRPLWMRTDPRGTEWVLAVIPFGGFVRMLDDRDPEQKAQLKPDSKAYMDLHPKWRIAIALGGPFANFLLAIVVFGVLQAVGSYEPVPMTQAPAADSPLGKAGLVEPAQIRRVDGAVVGGWEAVGLALTNRLGESGQIEFVVETPTSPQRAISVPIERWHEGVGDPDVVRSLGLAPSLLSVIGQVVPDTPAAAGGLMDGDWIRRVDGEEVANWMALVERIQQSPNESLTLDIVRQGTRIQAVVTPGVREQADGTQTGFLGVGPANHYVQAEAGDVVPNALAETWQKSVLILSILKKMVTGQVSVKNLSGPISIAQVAGDSAQYGWRQFLGILAFLSISLGVLNLLPIPILDGGHVIFSSAEWIMGKPVPEQVQIWGVQIGLVLVGSMLIFATYNDVLRLF